MAAAYQRRRHRAKVEIIRSVDRRVTPELIQAIVDRARQLAAEPRTYWTDQFNNFDNRNGYHSVGTEIMATLDRVSAFVQGVGTGGSFSGVAEVLKRADPDELCVAVEPANSRALSSVPPYGGHRIEGIGVGFKPSVYLEDLADETAAVNDDEAYRTARALATKEGIFAALVNITSPRPAKSFARSSLDSGPGERNGCSASRMKTRSIRCRSCGTPMPASTSPSSRIVEW